MRLWDLSANGFGNPYYAAGVRSMLQGAGLFFYNAFDPTGLVSLDKPPLAFWIQTIFAAVLGYSGWAIHLPQALAGTASVAMLYDLLRKPFGRMAALVAAFLLALSPIAVATDRSNNTDSWLVLFLLIAAWLALQGKGLSLVFAMVALGFAFNVKMLAALICGPALLAGWWLSSPLDWPRRLGWMFVAGLALAIVSLSWAVIFDLTPSRLRPQAGSSKSGSMLELIVVHNGLERFVRDRPASPATTTAPAQTQTPRAPAYDAVPVGPLRLANPMLAGQFAWALPFAVLGALLAWRRRRAQVALWAEWVLAYGIVYSAAGGIFHIYYLVTLAPPLAALAAIGGVELWRRGVPGHGRRGDGALAGLAHRRDARLDGDLDRLPHRGPARRRRRGMARPGADRTDRRRGAAGPAGGLGAQPGLLAGQSHAPVGQPAALAGPRRRARPDPVAQESLPRATTRSCWRFWSHNAAARRFSPRRPTRCWPRRSSSAAASRCWLSAATSATTRS